MEIEWSKVSNTLYPVRISHGGNTAGIPHFYQVSFLQEVRPTRDWIRGARTGVDATLTRRIKEIKVESLVTTRSGIIRTYTLSYGDAPPGGAPDGLQSMLVAVGSTAQPTQSFVYTPDERGYAEAATVARPSWAYDHLRLVNDRAEVSQTVMDMNGDGVLDLVRSSGHAAFRWSVWFGTANATTASFSSAPTLWTLPVKWDRIRGADSWVNCDGRGGTGTLGRRDTFDITGDGIPDRIEITFDDWTIYRGRSTPSWGFGDPEDWTGPEDIEDLRRTCDRDTFRDVVDMNADGLPDLVVSDRTRSGPPYIWNVYFNTGSGFLASPAPFSSPINALTDHRTGYGPVSQLMDFNGDGLPDLVASGPRATNSVFDQRCSPSATQQASCLEIYHHTGQGFAPIPVLLAVPRSNSLQLRVTPGEKVVQDLFDINGDGLPDWVYRRPFGSGYESAWRVLLNVGGAFEPLVYVPDADVPAVQNEGIPARVWNIAEQYIRESQTNGSSTADVIDINGDGLLDHVLAGSANWTVRLNGATERPNMLALAENGLGATNNLRYAPSTQFDNTGVSPGAAATSLTCRR